MPALQTSVVRSSHSARPGPPSTRPDAAARHDASSHHDASGNPDGSARQDPPSPPRPGSSRSTTVNSSSSSSSSSLKEHRPQQLTPSSPQPDMSLRRNQIRSFIDEVTKLGLTRDHRKNAK